MCKLVFAVAMPFTTLTYVNLSTYYRYIMLTKQTPKLSSSMCYNRTVMVTAGMMFDVCHSIVPT